MPKEVKEILINFKKKGYSAFIVGGYVRDFLLGKDSKDIDICTNAPIKELERIVKKKGNPYGVVTVKKKDFFIEITSFRKEIEYKNRLPKIIYTSSLKEDLMRRDFTINAICMDESEKIIDLLDGRKDLENKHIRIIGKAKTKLKEDPLRILRAIRFATVLNFSMEKDLEREIAKQSYLIDTLSTFRLKQELEFILRSPYYQKGLNMLKKYQLEEKMGIKYTNIVKTESLIGMWAQIEYTKNYPFTKKEKKHIVDIQEIVRKQKMDCFTLYKYGLEISLMASEIMGVLKENVINTYKDMPIHCFKEIKLPLKEWTSFIKKMENKKIQKMKNELIEEILLKKVVNDPNSIKEFMQRNKERWFI